jgi:glycine/D-amino acid oxidase-like deaminating enzyme
MRHDTAATNRKIDVVILGVGVIGSAVAYFLTTIRILAGRPSPSRTIIWDGPHLFAERG